MKIGKIVGGAVLLVVAVWVFIAMADPTARYVGGAILTILALALLIAGFRKK